LTALLDAYALLWAAWGHANLSGKAKDIIQDRSNELWLGSGTILLLVTGWCLLLYRLFCGWSERFNDVAERALDFA
jgi:hypothetical protein